MATLFGSGIKRREDPRLVTGRATYTDDVKLPGLLYAAILRSTYAHAKLKQVDVAKAKQAAGVVAVYTGADLKDKVNAVPCAWNVPNCDLKVPPHPVLAVDKVRYVGDGIALVVAESRAAARDAVDLIEVDYDPLDAVVDPERAAQKGAPQLHADVPNNVAFTWKVTVHGRDHIEHVELCGTKDGKITGLRTRVYAGLGGYASTAAPGIPTILHGLMYSGPYAIPNIAGTVYGVYTTTTPVDAYRGAGRPEATFLLERMIDLYARKIGMDPVEVRRKNLIPNDKFTYTVATGITYDSGNYQGALDKALQMIDYKN